MEGSCGKYPTNGLAKLRLGESQEMSWSLQIFKWFWYSTSVRGLWELKHLQMSWMSQALKSQNLWVICLPYSCQFSGLFVCCCFFIYAAWCGMGTQECERRSGEEEIVGTNHRSQHLNSLLLVTAFRRCFSRITTVSFPCIRPSQYYYYLITLVKRSFAGCIVLNQV